jgi:hypothetical protein
LPQASRKINEVIVLHEIPEMVDWSFSHWILDTGPLANGESDPLNVLGGTGDCVTKCQKSSEHMSNEYHYLPSLGIGLMPATSRTFDYDPFIGSNRMSFCDATYKAR